MDKKVRLSFSFPQAMKDELDKLAKRSRNRTVMGCVRLIMNQEVKRLKEREI